MHIPEGFSGFVTSTTAPVASGGSTSPGGPFTHWNNIAFSRRTPKAALWLAPTARMPLPSLVVFIITSSFKRAAVKQGETEGAPSLSNFLSIQTCRHLA